VVCMSGECVTVVCMCGECVDVVCISGEWYICVVSVWVWCVCDRQKPSTFFYFSHTYRNLRRGYGQKI